MYVYISKVGNLSKSDPEAPFSIATTPRSRKGRYSIPLIALLYPYLIVLSVQEGGIEYHFWVFVMTRPGIEPQRPGLLASSVLIDR